MPGVTDIDAVYRQTAEAARAQRAPLVERLEAIDIERIEIRAAIRKLDKLLAFIEPKPERGRRGTKRQSIIGAERLDKLTEHLRANYNNGSTFTVKSLTDDGTFEQLGFTNKTARNRSVVLLHERGILRLVRTDGLQKVWTVTPHG